MHFKNRGLHSRKEFVSDQISIDGGYEGKAQVIGPCPVCGLPSQLTKQGYKHRSKKYQETKYCNFKAVSE